MTVVSFILEELAQREVFDLFGYPGGFITPLMDAAARDDRFRTHLCYNEQGAAFAACGYARATGKPGVCFATSGPGALNLLNGIADAWFDSVPVIAITGQANTAELMQPGESMRQKGFQECDIVRIVAPVTKYAAQIRNAADVPAALADALTHAQTGRKGPCLLDLPFNIQRADAPSDMSAPIRYVRAEVDVSALQPLFKKAKHPIVLAGAGIRQSGTVDALAAFLEKSAIPLVTSMPATDLLQTCGLGFIGIYGNRAANLALSHADLILSLGSRLDFRQTGAKLDSFAPNAKLVRFDIDPAEFTKKIRPDEMQITAGLADVFPALQTLEFPSYHRWNAQCADLQTLLQTTDDEIGNEWFRALGDCLPPHATVTTDVGQNQVWAAQSLRLREGRILTSGGLGCMGFALPAAIGTAVALGTPVVCCVGDGGFQMNIQELQAAKNLPIKIIVFNNASLGMIRVFQTESFEKCFTLTGAEDGYTVPDFTAIASAYNIRAANLTDPAELDQYQSWFTDNAPCLLSVELPLGTQITPKLSYGQTEQSPPLPDTLREKVFSILKEVRP